MPFYCEEHAKDHDCEEEEMLLSVVSSPRMGMCSYTGYKASFCVMAVRVVSGVEGECLVQRMRS